MLAAISPCDIHFDETISSLKYIDRAKHIVNVPLINQLKEESIVSQLKEEVEKLRSQLSAGGEVIPAVSIGLIYILFRLPPLLSYHQDLLSAFSWLMMSLAE